MKFWKSRRRALGIGLGVGVAGAFALAFRHGMRRPARLVLPDDLSPAIFARRMAQTSQGDVVYHVSGSGEPVVFLHGMYPGASSYEWSKVYPRHVLGREVIAADLLGFGESERPDRALDASDYSESLADLLFEVARGRPPAVVAAGSACSLALLTASRHPERIAWLGLLAPRLPKTPPSWRPRGMALAAAIPPLGRILYETVLSRETFLREWVSHTGFADPRAVGAEVVRNLVICARLPGASRAILNILRGRLAVDLASRLERVHQPVVVFAPGDRAHGDAAILCEKLPAATFVPLPPCGELAALEHPGILSAALAPLLEDGPSPLRGAA
jgi:pimeloyl-ACP methyl ester carboxylesterase